MDPRRPRSRPLLVALAVVALSAVGCKDQLGDPAGPDPGLLDGGVLFASGLVSAEIYRAINRVAEVALADYEGSRFLPDSLNSCLGSGVAKITDNRDSDPATFAVTFENYVTDCGALALTWNTDITVDSRIIITILESSPGLVFEVSMPILGTAPRSASIQLPSDQGGFILAATTPLGPLIYELDGTRAAGGTVNVTGTVRLEDRAQPLLLVEDVRLQFEYADNLIPKFADWPGGSYEIAGFQGGAAGFGFGGASPSFPVDVFFDGLGGIAFPVADRSCVGNLLTGENPCAGL
jgi:hypothetical protein